MFKSNPLPGYVWGTFYTFWFLHCLYSLACVFGPFIFSGLNEAQKTYQANLLTAVIAGIFIPPALYLLLKFVPALANYKWFCLAAPLFLGLSVLFTVLMFRAADVEPFELNLKLGEERTVDNLSVRYVKFEQETATTGPDRPPVAYAVYFFDLQSGGKKGELSVPVEKEDAPAHEWNGYAIRVTSSNDDHSGVRISVLKK